MNFLTTNGLTAIKLLILPLVVALFLVVPQDTLAQTWSQCADGSTIVRCETYDCPNGDTNSDGSCTLADNGARLTDARNDAFCANPISGCGQVHYYNSTSSARCAIRVKESNLNCDLYSVSTPNFTPVPTTTSRPTSSTVFRVATPAPTTTASSSATATGSATTKGGLPETGPSLVTTLLLGATGLLGIFLYEKFRLE